MVQDTNHLRPPCTLYPNNNPINLWVRVERHDPLGLDEIFIYSIRFVVDAASRAKAEKIRLALEKMREASVQKLFIKAFTLDGSGKSLLVDEGMSVAHVSRLLADKNHVPMDPKWAVVEHLPDLFMGKEIILVIGEGDPL